MVAARCVWACSYENRCAAGQWPTERRREPRAPRNQPQQNSRSHDAANELLHAAEPQRPTSSSREPERTTAARNEPQCATTKHNKLHRITLNHIDPHGPRISSGATGSHNGYSEPPQQLSEPQPGTHSYSDVAEGSRASFAMQYDAHRKIVCPQNR